MRHLPRLVTVAVALILSLQALPARAADAALTTTTAPRPQAGWRTGLSAEAVDPLVRGFAGLSAELVVFGGCYLLLGSGEPDGTCVTWASHARKAVEG
jgi:hypothetical protein